MIPARVLFIPFLAMAGLGLYLSFSVDSSWSILILFGVLALVGLYVYEPAINWWWWNKFPPDLDPELKILLEKKSAFYQRLPSKEKDVFRKRVFFFRKGHNFMPQGIDKSPDDVELMIAIAPVAMTMHLDDYMFSKFENIIIYEHPFPSPQYETQFHASEIYVPEGVAMFCTSHIIRGFMEPKLYLNLAWYEYAKIFFLTYPDQRSANISEVTWDQIKAISGFSHEALQRWVGLEEIDTSAMTLACFFLFPDPFKSILPKLFATLKMTFAN